MAVVSVARSDLVRLAQVCRAWYEASTVLLYSRTILFSSRQLAHFRRTVQDSPSLAGLVKELSILVPKFERDSLLLLPLPWKGFDVVEDTLSIFKTCSAAEAVAIYSPDYTEDDTDPSVGAFPASTALPAGIRSLSLHSLVFESYYFPSQSLINLEVLCLNRYTFRLICGIPHLPLLHTLIIRGAKWWPDIYPIPDVISIERFPSLQYLYMYLNRFYLPLDRVTTGVEVPLLKTLHVIGEKEIKAFDVLVKYGYLSALQHLYIGSFPSKKHPFSTWVFPRTLQTLTVFIDEKHSKSCQKVISDCLKLNHTLRHSGATYIGLSRVVINVYSQTRILVEEDEVGKRVELEAIWRACSDFDIDAEIKTIGEDRMHYPECPELMV